MLQEALEVQEGSFTSGLRLPRLWALILSCLRRERVGPLAAKGIEPESETVHTGNPNRQIDAWLEVRAIQDSYSRPMA